MWKQPFANIIWKHQAWFGLVVVCYLVDFLPLQWRSLVLWPEPLSSSGYLKSEVPYSQPWLSRCLVSPSEVFHCVSRDARLPAIRIRKEGTGEGVMVRKRGRFPRGTQFVTPRAQRSPWLARFHDCFLLRSSLNRAAAPLPAQIHRILQSNFWQASEPHCFVVNFEEVFEW